MYSLSSLSFSYHIQHKIKKALEQLQSVTLTYGPCGRNHAVMAALLYGARTFSAACVPLTLLAAVKLSDRNSSQASTASIINSTNTKHQGEYQRLIFITQSTSLKNYVWQKWVTKKKKTSLTYWVICNALVIYRHIPIIHNYIKSNRKVWNLGYHAYYIIYYSCCCCCFCCCLFVGLFVWMMYIHQCHFEKLYCPQVLL